MPRLRILSPTRIGIVLGLAVLIAAAIGVGSLIRGRIQSAQQASDEWGELDPRHPISTSGFLITSQFVPPWEPGSTLPVIAAAYRGAAERKIALLDEQLSRPQTGRHRRVDSLLAKASLQSFDGNPQRAYETLTELRTLLEGDPELASAWLNTTIFFQGVAALRRGENENCIMCRGESSCILPIAPAAVHTVPEGSRLAIRHFMEYLAFDPDDHEVRWLLNLAHMTLGEYPQAVDPRFLVSIEPFLHPEFDIGRFRDIGHRVGLNQLTEGGGGIMDDFDNDGLLDIFVTAFDPTEHVLFLRNDGTGQFEDRSELAGLKEQFGGINCMQTDFNNDGYLDIFIVRGAWIENPVRPSLLRNNRDGTFTDVTEQAGLMSPVNSISASWTDYDNDGWLDLFVCCERQSSRLYHNERNGTFKDVTEAAQVYQGLPAKGANWIDYDNDLFPDLFISIHDLKTGPKLYRNNRDGTFRDETAAMGLNGPVVGFSCWAWDFDNDGWLDIFNTSYLRTVEDVVLGMAGKPHLLQSGRLYRNDEGRRFVDVTNESGLDLILATMGSNFGDFDNDGFLDMYLGTGDPDYTSLVPNRMFRNVDGKRFSEITVSAGTGNLQKGHGTACGDWDRDGNVDVFIEMGGAVPGDKYHNILFQNPGHPNAWLTVKLLGEQTNRAAIGARIKVVTGGDRSRTIHRHVSSGSSFGGNPLQQTIGLGAADSIELLEIQWPTSGTTQQFRNVAVNQAIEVTELAENFRPLPWTVIPVPPEK